MNVKTQTIKRRFSNNQPVVFRFGTRKLFGKVVLVRPVGKRYLYDVQCEDGKLYSELAVDESVNHCIDTYLTRLFYKKYNIDENYIPQHIDKMDEEECSVTINRAPAPIAIEEVITASSEDILYEEDDVDPNY